MAKKEEFYKYYCTQRPPMPGAIPKPADNPVCGVEAFDSRQIVVEIGMMAWGYAEYARPLTEALVKSYELVPAPRKEAPRTLHGALDQAWEKIREYCQEQYAGISTRDVQFSWRHDLFGWVEFGVTPDGEAYFVRGDHSKSRRANDASWYGHPLHQNAPAYTVYPALEEIVRDWAIIKGRLEKEFAAEATIFNFEP